MQPLKALMEKLLRTPLRSIVLVSGDVEFALLYGGLCLCVCERESLYCDVKYGSFSSLNFSCEDSVGMLNLGRGPCVCLSPSQVVDILTHT